MSFCISSVFNCLTKNSLATAAFSMETYLPFSTEETLDEFLKSAAF